MADVEVVEFEVSVSTRREEEGRVATERSFAGSITLVVEDGVAVAMQVPLETEFFLEEVSP